MVGGLGVVDDTEGSPETPTPTNTYQLDPRSPKETMVLDIGGFLTKGHGCLGSAAADTERRVLTDQARHRNKPTGRASLLTYPSHGRVS